MSKHRFLYAEDAMELLYDAENSYHRKKKKFKLPLSKLTYFDLDYLVGFFKRLNRLSDQVIFEKDNIVGVGFTNFKNNHKYQQCLSVCYKKDNKLKYAVLAPRYRKPSLEKFKELEK